MSKKIALTIICLAFAAACSRGISSEKYIEVMTELGCKGINESQPAAAEVFKEKKVTLEQLKDYRKKGDAKDMMKVSMEIANRVMACHGMGAGQ